MEPMQPPSLSASYQSFIAQNLESVSQYQINELHGRRIRACFHGWVILSDLANGALWSLWNPLTSKFIPLPPLIHKGKANGCCLSAPPDERDSVFLFTKLDTPTIVFCLLDPEKERLKWTEMSYANQFRSIGGVRGCYLEALTCCNGKLYSRIRVTGSDMINIVHVDIVVNEKEVVISLLPFVKIPYTSHEPFPSIDNPLTVYSFLKGSGTELFYINVFYIHESWTGKFNFLRLDMASMTWEKMEDLKDDAFFVQVGNGNRNLVFHKSKVSSDLAGYMHFSSGMDTIISSFHIKDRTMSLFSTPSFVRESQLLVWAMLECGRLEANHPKSKLEKEEKDNDIVVRPVKGDETKSDIATSESHLLNIPFHILEKLMKLCVGVEYMKFRVTCKHCSLAAPSIQWRSKTTLKGLQMYSLASPWLMVLDNHHGIITFIDPLYGDRYFIKTPQELKGDFQIYCSRFGWLLMYKKKAALVFFNPFTGGIHKLPMMPTIFQVECFCFSAPPTSPDCMVVGFMPHFSSVYIHHVSGEPSWRVCQLNFSSSSLHPFRFPTFSGRHIYTLCNNRRIEAFRDMNDEGHSIDVVVEKAPRSCCRHPAQYFPSNCNQHSLLVVVGEFGESVEVFKVNASTKEWERVDNLGKHMIYISNTSCICLEAKSPEMGNKIYFPKLLHGEINEKIVFYSLDTCRYHTFNDKIIQESFGADLFPTKHLCFPHTWIEPSWS